MGFLLSEHRKIAAKLNHLNTYFGQTQAVSAVDKLLVFYSHRVIYFENVKDKGKISVCGLTKDGTGTDTKFITSRQKEVWKDKSVGSTVSNEHLETFMRK